MPPYQPVVSQAQRKKLFALANRGELSMAEAKGKARAAKGKALPAYVKRPKTKTAHASHGSDNRYGALRHQ